MIFYVLMFASALPLNVKIIFPISSFLADTSGRKYALVDDNISLWLYCAYYKVN
jgi:hypothetical protein